MGAGSGTRIGKIEKTFRHQPATGNARLRKTNRIAHRYLRQNDRNNGISAEEAVGLLHQPLQPPEIPFQRPALDFVTGLPESQDPATGVVMTWSAR